MTVSALQTLPLVTVYDYLYDPTTGLALANAPVKVTFNVPLATVPPTSGGAANVNAVPKTFELTTDANGLWQVSLVPTNQINPANTTYHVSDGFESYDINPIQAGIPGAGWQASAIRTSAPAVLVATGQTVSNLTDTALTQGQVVFPGVGGLLSGDALLFWDNATKRLGVGVAAPLQPLHVVGNVRFGAATDFFWDNVAKTLLVGGDLTVSARLLMAAAVSKIRAGATSISLRNNADNADNFLVADNGLSAMRNALLIPPSAGGALAASSYGSVLVKIDEKTPAAANIDFAGIPAGFRHLVIEWQLRASRAALETMLLSINADAGNNYAWQRLNASGVAAPADTESGAAAAGFVFLFSVTGSNSPANHAGIGRIFIPNYAGTSFTKTLRSEAAYFQGAGAFPSAAQLAQDFTAGFWNSTAAINRIQLAGSGGTFTGVATLYGIP